MTRTMTATGPDLTALRDAIAAALPRLLTLMDRARFAPTRGSADRAYWHYRTDKDYPSATFAQAAWPLALLATRVDLVERTLRPRLADHALAAMLWWADLQHADGSFDEWFRWERSHVATAFTTFAVAEAAHALGERFAADPGRARIERALLRASRWLLDHHDAQVANHQAGSAAAVAAVTALIGDDELRQQAHGDPVDAVLSHLLPRQHEEGFFPEYGGAAPGYASVSCAFLAHVRRRRPSAAIDAAIQRLLRFMTPFCQPDGSYGGEYGRRATRYAWLSGPALLAAEFPAAAALCRTLLAGLERGAIAPANAYDDRYCTFFALPDLVCTLAALDGQDCPESPQAAGTVRLDGAGIAIYRTDDLHVVFGGAVGGVIKVHLAGPPGTLLFDDCGYAGRTSRGLGVASWRHGARVELGPDHASAAGLFCRWSRSSPVERHAVGFRLFVATVGRLLGPMIAAHAKAKQTGRPDSAPLRLERRLEVAPSQVVIHDRLTPLAPNVVEELRRVAAFAPVHVPSAPLWLPAFEPRLPATGPDLAESLASSRPLDVKTTITVGREHASVRVEVTGITLQEAEVALERSASTGPRTTSS